MPAVEIQILRYVDDQQPGWIECHLVDAAGDTHAFVEKVPVAYDGHLDAASIYPQLGSLACTVIERSPDGLCIIDTAHPYGITSTADLHRFTVHTDQLLSE